MNVVPIFTSHYSIGEGSLLFLTEPGKSKSGSPLSVFDLIQSIGLKEVVLCESKIDGFIEAYKTSNKLGVKLCFGWKTVLCADMTLKDESSLQSESKIVIFCKDTQGYHDLLRLHNRATVDGFYYRPRLDHTTLRALWTDRLLLALPYFSSFLAVNQLTFKRIVPDLPARPWLFKEQGHGLPFGRLIDGAIDRYVADNPAEVVLTKQIYYPTRAHFVAHQTIRAVNERGSYNAPGVEHLASDAFCWDNYLSLCPPPTPPPPASL
jgi:DNA polymerase III alpha subunit